MTTAVPSVHGDDAGGLPRLDAFLEAKLNPPPVRSKWIERNRLVRALDSAISDCPVILVAAPAGYGKTTTIVQWLSRPASRRTAWVGLDPADNDPVRLWTHVVIALERAGCSFGTEASGLVERHRTEIVSRLLPRVINSIAELAEPVIVVLDDYHVIRNRACHEQIEFLLKHLSDRAAVVILTRADPDLHLGRMRAAGQLAEVRAEHLSFDLEETSALLSVQDVQLSDVAIKELVERTEGWPAGVYLAILSLSGRDAPETFIHEFSGDDRYIGDYLTEEVLSRHSDEVRSFILRVSILERFSAALCDHVLETTGSSSIVRELERTNLFLTPLDVNRQWYRFHSLFAAVARSELEAQDAELVARLHDRASDWFASHGYVDEAVRHAIAAGSPARAARLVQANWARYVSAGRAATVEGWLGALGVPDPASDPAALVTAAWMALVKGDEGRLNDLLGVLADVDDDTPLPDGTSSVGSAVVLIRGMSGYGGPLEILAAGRRAVELETEETSPWFAFAHFALGHGHYVAGDLQAAMSELPKAAYTQHSLAIIRQFALAAMAMVAREQDDLALSARYAQEAVAVVEQASLGAVPQASTAYTVMAECTADQGDLAAAMTAMTEILAVRHRFPGLSPWPTIHHLLAMSRVSTTAGELDLAGQLLDEAAQLMARFPEEGMAGMRARLTAARVRLRRRAEIDHGLEPLTGRELDVLRLLQTSMNLTEIADALYLSRNTVKTHVQASYRKLGARSRSEAVSIARRRALL